MGRRAPRRDRRIVGQSVRKAFELCQHGDVAERHSRGHAQRNGRIVEHRAHPGGHDPLHQTLRHTGRNRQNRQIGAVGDQGVFQPFLTADEHVAQALSDLAGIGVEHGGDAEAALAEGFVAKESRPDAARA